MIVKREHLVAKTPHRPAGYIAEVESAGTILPNGDVELTHSEWNRLAAKYRVNKSKAELEQLAAKRRELWQEFHRAAALDAINEEWLSEFTPKADIWSLCSCGNHWRMVLKDNPPPEKDQLAWSIAIHNGARSRTGSPPLTDAEIAAYLV